METVTALSGKELRYRVVQRDTFWGYVISQGRSARRRDAIGEYTAMGCSVAFGILAFGLWLPGSTQTAFALVPFKMAMQRSFLSLRVCFT